MRRTRRDGADVMRIVLGSLDLEPAAEERLIRRLRVLGAKVPL